ncbi:MAG: TolC family protein [Balneolaceae bacterium]
MTKKLTTLILFVLCIGINSVYSQGLLSLEEAIKIGIENNYSIQIANNEAEIDRMNRTLGNAGFLPTITASGNRDEIFESETTRTASDGRSTEDFEASLLSADVDLTWTLFDGLRMFTNYQRLGELQNLGETLSRVELESIVTEITVAYYEIVRQEKLLGVLQNSVDISEERYEIAQSKRELGSGSEYELLLAQSDLNTDRAEFIRQETILNDSKLDLIRLLDLDSDSQFDTFDTISISETMPLDELYSQFAENNRDIRAGEIRTSITELEIREFRRERMPEIDFNVGYTYNREEIRNSMLFDQTDGLYVGVTARFNLFDGFNTNRQVQTAKINHKNERLRLQEQKKSLEMTLLSEYENYTNSIQLVGLEQENLELAEEALDIALEQFQLATITSLELRETQRIVFDTENRLIDAQFVAIVAETELLELAGVLLESLGL